MINVAQLADFECDRQFHFLASMSAEDPDRLTKILLRDVSVNSNLHLFSEFLKILPKLSNGALHNAPI